MKSMIVLALSIYVMQPMFSADRIFADAAPTTPFSPVPPVVESRYKLTVVFKKALSTEQQKAISNMVLAAAPKPLTLKSPDRDVYLALPVFRTPLSAEMLVDVMGPSLNDDEVSSVKQFAANMVNGYLIPSNGASSTTFELVSDTAGKKFFDDNNDNNIQFQF